MAGSRGRRFESGTRGRGRPRRGFGTLEEELGQAPPDRGFELQNTAGNAAVATLLSPTRTAGPVQRKKADDPFSDLLGWQQMAGNRAVTGLLQSAGNGPAGIQRLIGGHRSQGTDEEQQDTGTTWQSATPSQANATDTQGGTAGTDAGTSGTGTDTHGEGHARTPTPTATVPANLDPVPTVTAESKKELSYDNENYGKFTWGYKWGVSGDKAQETDGWIVKHVTYTWDVHDKDGNAVSVAERFQMGDMGDFYEAWKVKHGEVFIGQTQDPHECDTVMSPGLPDTKGWLQIEGHADYYHVPNLTGFSVKPESPAGQLPVSKTAPASNQNPTGNPKEQTIKIEWNERGETQPPQTTSPT